MPTIIRRFRTRHGTVETHYSDGGKMVAPDCQHPDNGHIWNFFNNQYNCINCDAIAVRRVEIVRQPTPIPFEDELPASPISSQETPK